MGNPTIYGPVQLRSADFMIALVALFGWPKIGGVTLGCFLTNAYYFIGAPDVIFGPIANLIAAYLVLFLRKRHLLACIIGALPIGFRVGVSLAFVSAARNLRFTRVGWYDLQYYRQQLNCGGCYRVPGAFDIKPTEHHRAVEVSWTKGC